MLDRLSPLQRHFVLLVAPGLLAFAGQDLVPDLQSINPALVSLAAALVGQAALYVSRLTTQYGSGSTDPNEGAGEV